MPNEAQDKIVVEQECACPLTHREPRSAFAFWMLHQAVLQRTKDHREASLENLARQHDFISEMEMRADLVLVFCEDDRVSLTKMWEALPQKEREVYDELARREQEQPKAEGGGAGAAIPNRRPDTEFSSELCSCGAWDANYAKTVGNMMD